MPAVSEKQRRAMWAAAEGRSTLGIPRDVGKEFVGKDGSSAAQAAGTMYVAPDGRVLLLRRSPAETNYAGYWAWPGGGVEPGESAAAAAIREAGEELGTTPPGTPRLLDRRLSPNGVAYHTFVSPVTDAFEPQLNGEHDGHVWAKLSEMPQPLHPGVIKTLEERVLAGAQPEEWDEVGSQFAGWANDPNGELIADCLAMDKDSVRSVDADGHLHVALTPVSKSNVCEYYGREIPDSEALGLHPDRKYKLLRDPKELRKAAPTWARKPILLVHTPISADDHPREVTVGTIGDDVSFAEPYLKAPLTIWDGEAIKLIESGKQRELSSSYRYTADMTSGRYEGEAYDGVMRDIACNHVALVKKGRAGPDVIVGDSEPKEKLIMTKTVGLSRMGLYASGAIMAYLSPRLAADAQIDLTPVFTGLTSKNFTEKRPGLLTELQKLVKGKLAADANIEDVAQLLDVLGEAKVEEPAVPGADPLKPGGEADPLKAEEPGTDDGDSNAKLMEFLQGKLSPEDMAIVAQLCGGGPAMDNDNPNPFDKKDDDNMVDKKAMDEAIAKAKEETKAEMQRNQREVRAAEEHVRPYVGKLVQAFDSAAEVYRSALTTLGVKGADKLHVDALLPVLQAQPLPGTKPVHANGPTPPVAMDAAAVTSFRDMFPKAQPTRHLA